MITSAYTNLLVRTCYEGSLSDILAAAYTNLLVRTCYEGSLSDILAVLVPCACGYVEIGQKLKLQGLPENQFYRDWIDTYSSREFLDLTNWLIEKMNEHAHNATAQQRGMAGRDLLLTGKVMR
jgi:thiaminase/transcriptional activator TenA